MKISGPESESTVESYLCVPCLNGRTPWFSGSPKQGMPVARRHNNIRRVPSAASGPQKGPSATYLASRAKYVPGPHKEAPRVPDANGWKPDIGLLTIDSTAAVPWKAQ